jgi:hypothetical protein
MWQLENQTPFAVGRSFTRDQEGREIWQVAIKASFLFTPQGNIQPAPEQPEVCLAAEYWSDENGSLRYEQDFALDKVATDVIVNGSAHVPAGKQATQLDIGFQVANLEKQLTIVGQRRWQKGMLGLKPSEPEPFQRCPLRWEYAYGGQSGENPETGYPNYFDQNPVGTGYYRSEEEALGKPLPNILLPEQDITKWKAQPTPAGLGVVAESWLPRRDYGGTYDEQWQTQRSPLLPEDYSPKHCQYAPEDQQIEGFLQGGETVVLNQLTPQEQAPFQLPLLEFELQTRFSGMPLKPHEPPFISALIIEPDEFRFSLVYQSNLPCQGWEDELESTQIQWLQGKLS